MFPKTAAHRVFLATLAVLLGGCAAESTHRVASARDTKLLIAEHEKRLLRPFEVGNTVICDTLGIQVNPVFYRHVTRPAGRGRTVTNEDFKEMSWHTSDRISFQSAPGGQGADTPHLARAQADFFRLKIGSTWFWVGKQVKIRLLHRAPPTLTAHASGRVVVTNDAKTVDHFDELRFADGRVQSR